MCMSTRVLQANERRECVSVCAERTASTIILVWCWKAGINFAMVNCSPVEIIFLKYISSPNVPNLCLLHCASAMCVCVYVNKFTHAVGKKLAMDMSRNLLCMYNFLIKTYIRERMECGVGRERERESAVQCMQNRSAESVCELWRQFEIFPIRISKARIHANSIGASVNDDRYTIFHHMTFFHSTLFTSIASYWNTAAVVTIAGNQFFHCLDWSLSTVTKFISNLNLIKKLEIELNQPRKKIQ